jgi:hypothetical protein
MYRTCCFAFLLALATAGEAQVVGGIAEVSIIDRDNGVALTPHFYRGEYWVAGRPGARYAIEIRNRLGERVLAVMSVDGVNILSGATAGWDQSGYVFGPGERYQITGWRKTDAEVAAFTFTDLPNSYAARTGRPANVGVIGVAVFRERRPQPVYVPPMIGQSARPGTPGAAGPGTPLSGGSMANSAQAGTSSSAATLEVQASPTMPAPMALPELRAPATPKLGTGHGEREYSYVNHTEFSRMQAEPNELIRIHYDSLDNLFAMGIFKRPRPAPPTANPFPASPDLQYVPDPPG